MKLNRISPSLEKILIVDKAITPIQGDFCPDGRFQDVTETELDIEIVKCSVLWHVIVVVDSTEKRDSLKFHCEKNVKIAVDIYCSEEDECNDLLSSPREDILKYYNNDLHTVKKLYAARYDQLVEARKELNQFSKNDLRLYEAIKRHSKIIGLNGVFQLIQQHSISIEKDSYCENYLFKFITSSLSRQYCAGANPYLPIGLQVKLATYNMEIAPIIAVHTESQEVLVTLTQLAVTKTNRDIAIGIASNKFASGLLLEEISETFNEDDVICVAIARNRNANTKTLITLSYSDLNDVRRAVAFSHAAPAHLGKDADRSVREALARNYATSSIVLLELAIDKDLGVRRALVNRSDLYTVAKGRLIDILIQDKDINVLNGIVLNENTMSRDVFFRLLKFDKENLLLGLVYRQNTPDFLEYYTLSEEVLEGKVGNFFHQSSFLIRHYSSAHFEIWKKRHDIDSIDLTTLIWLVENPNIPVEMLRYVVSQKNDPFLYLLAADHATMNDAARVEILNKVPTIDKSKLDGYSWEQLLWYAKHFKQSIVLEHITRTSDKTLLYSVYQNSNLPKPLYEIILKKLNELGEGVYKVNAPPVILSQLYEQCKHKEDSVALLFNSNTPEQTKIKLFERISFDTLCSVASIEDIARFCKGTQFLSLLNYACQKKYTTTKNEVVGKCLKAIATSWQLDITEL